MSVEQAIKKMLQERATLPIGNMTNGDTSQPPQGASQPNPAEEEDENAPGTTTAQGINQTGLPIGNQNNGDEGGNAPQGSSGNAMPSTPAPVGKINGEPAATPQGSSGNVMPGMYGPTSVTTTEGKVVTVDAARLTEAFTKKHFIATAELIKSLTDHKQRNEIGDKHIEMFKRDNPRFDIVKFKKAAGMDAESQQNESVRTTELKESIAALFAGQENLAEGFMDKATSLFEAAVIGRVNNEMVNVKAILESDAEKELVILKAALSEQVNTYLTEMVKAWAAENKLAIDQGLKNEVSESFMSGLRDLFAEHYIEVPENKIDVLESLTSELESSKARINEEVNSKLAIQKELTDLKKQAIVAESSKGMTATDADRLLALVEGVEFESHQLYTEKVAVIKEAHFKKTVKKSAEMLLAESTGHGEPEQKHVSKDMQVVLNMLGRGKDSNLFSE